MAMLFLKRKKGRDPIIALLCLPDEGLGGGEGWSPVGPAHSAARFPLDIKQGN
jgi:hypothetical protein